MVEAIYDARFAFRYDNPFEGDINKSCLTKLKQYFASNQQKFTEVDWYDDSRYLILRPDIQSLFGVDNDERVNNKLNRKVKSFLLTIPYISSDLKEWCNESVEVAEPPKPSLLSRPSTENIDDTLTKSTDNFDFKYEPNIIPISSPKFAQSLSTGMHYDISTDKTLSYEDVCKLCLNIARTKLVEDGIPKDETVEALERDKRKKLTNEIMRYKNNKLIDPLVEGDLSSMSLEQLETCLEQCIQYQENFKTLEVFKRGFSAGGIIYDMVFPEGIPLGKSRKLCFKGIGKEILSTLFNATTTTGIAFQNILRKNNIKVSDELLTLIAFGEICISKVEIKKVEPENKENVPLKNEKAIPRIKQNYNTDDELMSVDDE